MIVTMPVVALLLVCSWISIITAQPNTVTVLPQDQSVCRGENILFNCTGSGTSMELFSPPIVNDSSALLLISSIQRSDTISNSAAAVIFFVEPSSFIGILTLHISPEQREGQRTVFCRVTAADGMPTTNEATFSILGTPNPVTSLNFQALASSSEDVTQVPVNVSWDSPENAQEFMLQISNMDYNITLRSLENSVTVLLPYGTYSATVCTINRCDKICQNYPNIFSAERQPRSKDNSSLIAPAVVAGVLGLFFILASIYGVIVTVMICKKDKLNAGAIAADETKEMQMD